MKTKRSIAAAVALLLVFAALFYFTRDNPTRPSEEDAVASSGAQVLSGEIAADTVGNRSHAGSGEVPAKTPEARTSSTRQAGDGGSTSPEADVPDARKKLLEGAETLAQRVVPPTSLDAGFPKRERIVRVRDFKYPYLRVVEPLDKDGQPIAEQGEIMVADHFIFKKAEALDEQTLEQELSRIDMRIRKKMLAPDTYLVATGPMTDPAQLLGLYEVRQKELRRLGRPEPDYIMHISSTLPNDPGLQATWGLRNVEHQLNLGGTNYLEGGKILFSGALPVGGIAATVVDCGVGDEGEFPGGVNGNIAFIRRGGNTFKLMAERAAAAGAVAVVLANNEEGGFSGTIGEFGDLPFMTITQAEGNTIVNQLPAAGTLTAQPTDRDIDAENAWNINRGSRDVLVAVIDTGVDYTHEDLAANMWMNTGETGTDGEGNNKATNGIDDDGNGFIDDVRGYDFYNDDGNPMDDHMHGTHCAGTIGAVGDNGTGVTGVNWEVSMMGIKFLGAGGSGATSDAVDSVYYAIQNGADLTSNSYGGGGFLQAMTDAIEAANADGQLYITAAGNDGSGSPQFPAGYENENIISVAAIDMNDKLASFSNFGVPHTDIGAPGVAVVSTVPTTWTPSGYLSVNGTSMATPHVAGVAALLKAQVPSLPHLEARQRILEMAVPIPALEGVVTTGARLNAFKVLAGITEQPSYALVNVDVDDAADGNGDGVLNPGETAALRITVINNGYSNAVGVVATASSGTAHLTFSDNTSTFGNIDGRGEGTAADPLVLSVNAAVTSGSFVDFTLQFTDDDSNTYDLPVSLYVSDTYTLSGQVSLDGAPVAGAEITYEGILSGSVTTAGNGQWTANVGEGNYAVRAAYQGTELSRTNTLSATTPGNVGGLDFTLTTATISGMVRDQKTLAPVEGATLTFRGPFSFSLTTDAGGNFSRTDVYGREVSWTFRTSHPAYDFAASQVAITLPPSQTGLIIEMGPPELDFTVDHIQKRLVADETGSEPLVLQNAGAADLEWSASVIVNPDETHAGESLAQFNQPADFYPANSNSGPPNGAFDGEYIYWQTPQTSTVELFRMDREDGSTTSINVLEAVPSARAGWRLVGHDGKYFWFSAFFEDGADSNIDYMVLYQVDLDAGVVVRRVEVDRNVLYYGSPQGNNLLRAEISGRAIGGGSAWLLWKRNDVPTSEEEHSYWVAEVDLADGGVRNAFQIPEELYIINEGKTTHSGFYMILSKVLGGAICYMNDAIWVGLSYAGGEQDQFKYFLKLNASTGELERKIFIPDFFDPDLGDSDDEVMQVKGMVPDETGAIWMWEDYREKVYAIHTGEMLWVRPAPIGGSLPFNQAQNLNLDFFPEFAAAGLNHGAIRFATNDPARRAFYLPVTLFVGANEEGNSEPLIDSASPVSPLSLAETDEQAFSMTASDADAHPMTRTWVRNGRIIAGQTAPTWTWQTGFDDAGAHAILAAVEDGHGGFALADWQVNIANTNRAPVAEDGSGTLANNETLDIPLEASDADGDALTYSIVDPPAHGNVVIAGGEATYTPAAQYVGNDSFTFKVNDGEADSNIATISLIVGTRRLIVDVSELEVAVEVGSSTTRVVTLENTGTLSVRWASPMDSLTPTSAGQVLWRVEELPSSYSDDHNSGNAHAMAYDGTNFYVAYADYSSRQRDDVSRFQIDPGDPETTNELSFHRSSDAGHWIRRMAWDGDSFITFTDSYVRNYTNNFSYLRDIRLPAPNGYAVDKEMRVVKQNFGPFIGGVTAGWGRHWIAALGSYSGGTYTPGGISMLDPETWETISRQDYAEGVLGGACLFWNGALWTGGRGNSFGTDYISKINPVTGEELDRVPYPYSLGTKGLAVDAQGRFYYLQVDKLADDDLLVVRSGDYLRMNPYAGEIAPGETVQVEVTFDGETAGPGSHQAILHIISNDPTAPDQEIPVTFGAGVNFPPSIDSYTPSGSTASAKVKEVTTFEVVATDPNAAHVENLSYEWSIDGVAVEQSDTPVFGFMPTADQVGTRTLAVTVTDPGDLSDTHSWSVNVSNTSFTVTPEASTLAGVGPLDVDFFAWVTGAALDGAFTETDGLLIVEAEDASIDDDSAWPFMDVNIDYSGGTALFPVVSSDPGSWAASAKAAFPLQFTNSGTYYLWMRVQPFVDEQVSQNSAYVGLEGDGVTTQSGVFDDQPGAVEQLKWHRYEQTFDVPGGLMTFSIGARETAYTIDRILFTQDPNYTPTGRGPNWNSPRIPASTYSWTFPGATANGSRAGHTFTQVGAHSVQVQATSASGTDTSSLTILVQQLFGSWQAGITWPDAADSTGSGNPDGDPFSNQLEFLLGLDPLTADGWDAVTQEMIENPQGQWFVLDYRRAKLSSGDSLVPVSSASLAPETWSEVIVDGVNVIETILDPDVDGDGTVEKIRLQIKLDPADNRLNVRLIAQ